MTLIKKFSKNHTFIFSILFTAVAIFLLIICATMIFKYEDNTSINAVLYYILPMLFVFSIIFALGIRKQIGFHARNIGTGILLGWLIIIFGIVVFVSDLMNTGIKDFTLIKSPAILFFTLHMFLIGLFEELVCRGVMLNIMINKWGYTKKSIMKSVMLSSAVFGLIHLFNLIVSPELVLNTLAQAIYAFFIGIFFASVYLRCKNIWSVIILHALFDWFSGFCSAFSTDTTATAISDISINSALTLVLITVPFALVGLFLLRKVMPNERLTTSTT